MENLMRTAFARVWIQHTDSNICAANVEATHTPIKHIYKLRF